MACPAFGSSSGVSVYYCVDADPDAALGATLNWNEVPITGESLSANLTASISDRITSNRSYANSVITQGEVSGSISYEAEYCDFVNLMLKSVLQSSSAFASDSDAIKNGSTPACYAFMKRVQRGTKYDYYIYRGVQIDSMSFSISPNSFITGEINTVGVRFGKDIKGGTNAILQDSSAAGDGIPVGWTLLPLESSNLMSSVFALQNLVIDDGGGDVGLTMQDMTITFSNQLRAQNAIGAGSPYASGVASGRFQCTLSGTSYYSGPQIIELMLNDGELAMSFDILDATDKGWSFTLDKVKVTSSPPPQASGPDQDLTASTELQAFEDSANGTVKITLNAA